jgi:hypothetical protein
MGSALWGEMEVAGLKQELTEHKIAFDDEAFLVIVITSRPAM